MVIILNLKDREAKLPISSAYKEKQGNFDTFWEMCLAFQQDDYSIERTKQQYSSLNQKLHIHKGE
jgi:hypothetical protein